MVLRKNEYSRKLNASYTSQPLMKFSSDLLHLNDTHNKVTVKLRRKTKKKVVGTELGEVTTTCESRA